MSVLVDGPSGPEESDLPDVYIHTHVRMYTDAHLQTRSVFVHMNTRIHTHTDVHVETHTHTRVRGLRETYTT